MTYILTVSSMMGNSSLEGVCKSWLEHLTLYLSISELLSLQSFWRQKLCVIGSFDTVEALAGCCSPTRSWWRFSVVWRVWNGSRSRSEIGYLHFRWRAGAHMTLLERNSQKKKLNLILICLWLNPQTWHNSWSAQHQALILNFVPLLEAFMRKQLNFSSYLQFLSHEILTINEDNNKNLTIIAMKFLTALRLSFKL